MSRVGPLLRLIYFMPIVPQSEIQVKFFEKCFKETDEKRGEILAKISDDFRPSISREIGHKKKFTQIPPHIRTSNSTRLNPNSFTAILWELVGPIYCTFFPFGEPRRT